MRILLFLLILPSLFIFIDGQCTWPSQFVSSTWTDNARGSLVFTQTTMSGWSFEKDTQVINDWQCTNVDQFESDGYLVMRSVNTFIQFVTSNYYAYLCLKMTLITDVSYRYYVMEPQQPELDWDRYLVATDGTRSTVAKVCYDAYGASGAEYNVMIKSGQEGSATVSCPWIFLGSFDYTHTSSSSGATSCSAGGNTWDMCTDTSSMSFDLSACSVDVPYSGTSTVQCVDTVPVGSENYITVYNSGSFDDVNTFQFACFAVNGDLTTASVAPGYCRDGQTSTSYPVDTSMSDPARSDIGALISITSTYERCYTCPVLDSPDGGSVNIETNGATTTAYYTCNSGYALYGDSERICQENSTWTGQPPTCKCEAPSDPDHGSVSVSVDGSTATYTCDIGYVLEGNHHRWCQTDGNAWNGTDPTCETCTVLGDLTNGNVTFVQESYTTAAIFFCDVGFSLLGPNNITCQADGTWSDSLPTCVACQSLTSPSLGNITLSSDGLVTSAQFACTDGYKVLGDELLSCLSNTSWDSVEPSCICDDPEAPTFGQVTVDNTGMLATYTCDVGYTMDGERTRDCQLDGTSWSGAVPSCVTCSSVPTAGANVTLSTNGTQTSASYSCLPGYTMIGEVNSECSTTGIWTPTAATCVSCSILASPTSGNVSVTSNGTVSTAEYTCINGYTLSGTSTRTCLQNGTWDGEAAQCDCEELTGPANGNLTVTGQTAYYTCEVNYTLSGESELVCRTDGTGWNNSPPTCVECQYLQDISGGSIALSSVSGLNTTAQYACDVGYTLVGVTSRTCKSDGTWGGSAPYCQLCDTIQSPNNGTVTLTTDGSKTLATFSCDVGYTVNDVTVVTSECDENGDWESTNQECISCEQLTNISSGAALVSSNGTFTTVTYACVFGYDLVGVSTRTCLSTGTWSDMEPRCKCEAPNSVSNGSVTVSSDGMLAFYTCNSGYSLNGMSNITCQEDGSGWDNSSPSCVRCDDLTDPTDGLVTLTTDGSISIATYTCDVGYSLDGSGLSFSTCNTDGSWTDQSPNCVECETLTTPDSGTMTLSFNETGTQALFSCVSGYYLDGQSLLTCGQNGTWDYIAPTCVCEIPTSPENGSISVSSDGLTITYSCDIGHSLNGDATRTCQSNGHSWSGSAPSCVSCDTAPTLSDGNIGYTSNGTVTEVTFSCTVGYTLYSVTGETSAACNDDGTWSTATVSCVQCDTLSSPSSGSLSLSTDGLTTSAAFWCESDYYMVGENTSMCDTSGVWTTSTPSCLCVLPSVPTNGQMAVSNDNLTLTLTCDVGYIQSGSTLRNCSSDGTGWSGVQPTCETCDALSTPTNGHINFNTDGSVTTAVVTCESGSSISGSPTLTCNIDGSWDLDTPDCISCPTVSNPSSGSVVVSTNGTLSKAEFTCSAGYHVVGNDVISCQTDGTWSEAEPVCVCDAPTAPTGGSISLSDNNMTVYYSCDSGNTLSGQSSQLCSTDGTGWAGVKPSCVSCPTVAAPTRGTVNITTDGTTSAAYFTCDLGSTMDGSSTSSCTTNGTWDSVAPTCVQCADLSNPDSGSVALTTDGEQTTASYTCVTGYEISGSASLTCQTDGQWSDTAPSCVCIPPLTPTNGQVAISEDGMTASFTCSAGYTLKGVSVRTCQSNGVSWNEAQPTCETCDALSNPTGGSVNLTTSGSVTSAEITCQAGYTINGGSTLTCRTDGTWDISVPTCGVCSALSPPSGGTVNMYSENSVTKANFSCESGYTLSGAQTLTCRTDGSWDFNEPACVKCTDLHTVNSGIVGVYSDGLYTYASISCAGGYYLNGDNPLTCTSDGSWDNELPTCVCNPLNDPPNGSIALTSSGMVAEFSCDLSFSLDGSTNASCSQDGAGWDNNTPNCVSCPELASAANGSVEIVTDGTTTTWSLSCDVGTSISSTGTMSCQTDGTWSTVQPSCVTCPAMGSPTNGEVTLQTDGETTVATFRCDLSYSMNGNEILTCLSDGTWNSTQPTCGVCDSLSVVDSGDVTYNTNGVVTIATFSCNSGYFVSGAVNISCLQDGSWDNGQPSCVCDTPAAPTDSSVWVSGDGMSLQYTCNSGYSLNGANINTCQNDGTGWKYAHPSCVECQTIFEPINGGYMVATDGSSTYSVFTCDTGYSLNMEENIVTCGSDGTWDQTSLNCVQCESLTVIDNGLVNITSGGSSSIAQYTCVVGYTLLGDIQRSCLTNGSWDGSEPTCVCNSPTAPANGHVSVSDDFMTAAYTCDTGYTLDGVSQRNCGNDGTGWSDQTPTCEPCETLGSVTGGSVALWTDGQSTFANFTCKTGFSMDGEPVIQCRNDGSWNFKAPSCTNCESLSTVSGGTYSYNTDGQTTSVTYVCDVGYSLSGSPSSSCSSVGSWSTAEPECIPCPQLVDPDSGFVSITTDGSISTANFTCTTGYHIVGDAVSVCGEDGSWNSTDPVCVCDSPTSISDGTVTISTNGSLATYSCNVGYTLDGDIQRFCAQDGSGWNGTAPQCVTCDTLISPTNGSLDITTDGVNTYATVSCDVGFTSTGDAILTCQSDGIYDTAVPSCAECQTLIAPTNGTLSLSSNSTQTTVTFTCDVGYSLKGEDISHCLSDGSWSFSEPTCQTCEQFPDISSGSYSSATNGTTSYVTVQCAIGYYLDGEAVVTCSDDGIWSHSPACLCEDPVTPVNGAMTSTGLIATFTCDSGYSMSGTSVSVCRSDGGGWLIASPSCVQCDTLTSISQGDGQISTDGSQTLITYSCPVGYTLDGDVENYCNSDGTWSSTVPNCTTCESLSNPASGTVHLESDNATTSALYACASGYQLVGDDRRICLSNGTWTLAEPTCVCIDPDSPSSGYVNVNNDKTVATYICEVGYTLNGESTRTCQTEGSGWTATAPTCSLCDTISSPSGGAVTLSTDGEVTIASFTCSAGYTMDGGSTLACRDDGSWNTSAPTCVLCDSVNTPQNGAYTTVTDGETSTTIFTCDTGFTLQGTSYVTCAVSGRYTESEPTCSQCDILVTPDSGSLVTSTNGTVTTAAFACDAGYYLNGAMTLFCATDGTWNESEPECRCNPPPTIANGFYNVSTNGSVVTYSCMEGFTMNGEMTQNCQSSGLGWDSSQPLCVGCDSLATPENGSVVVSTDGSVTSATVSCSVGTTLVGESDIECTVSGTWTVLAITCATCDEILAPANGNITMNSNGTFSMASFKCNTGYTLSGSDISTCASDGTWSSSAPTCVKCPVVEYIDNGDVNVNSDGLLTSVQYTCHSNYGLSGSGILTCRTDGSWNDSVPSCVCDPPLSPVDGSYTISADGMTLTYTCDFEFTMVGSPVRTCATDSSGWSGSPPTCNKCDSISSITDGDFLITTDGSTTAVTYSCNLGYSVSGDFSATCDESGTWNITAPSCVQCPVLNTLTNGEVNESTDGVVTKALYECLSGYYIVGDTERECTDGAWDGSAPVCLCSSSTFFSNGAVVSNGSVISYTCDSGYSLNGVSQRTCQDDGSGWSLTEPACMKCETLSTPAGGNITLFTDGTVTIASVTCLTGYTMSGTPTLTCGSDGTWDHETPSCGVPCSALGTPTGGHVTLETDGLTTTAVYECDANYTLSGVSQLTCRTDGSWDFIEPTCEQCDVITSPTNGYMNVTTDGATSMASFTCHGDYYLDGSSSSICSSSGSWSNAVPNCICNSPGPISYGNVSVSDDGLTATYKCTSGFTLYGSNVITCQDNYQGWSANDTRCASCGSLPQVLNGSVSMVTDGVTSTAEFSCDAGYSIKGETTVQCDSNGVWVSSFPECVSCIDLDDIVNGTTLTTTDGHTTSKTYQCNLGYSLNGQSEISCLEDGSWSSSPPDCVTCDEMSTPTSGFRNDITDGLFSYTEFSCVSSYHLVGNSVIQCQTDGSWNGSSPSCVCDTPAVPLNAVLSYSSDGTIVDYSCSEGYSLNGEMSRDCSNTGLGWLGTAPSCVKCTDVENVVDGNSTLATNGSASTVEFACATGFTLNGERQITCDENGVWSANISQCVSCDDIFAPASGSLVISSNGTSTTVYYSCDSGYSLVGDVTRTCIADGTWTSETPECACEDPVMPVDGNVVSTGYKATYTCDTGFTLYGEYIRVCNNDSTGWNGTEPTCVACASLDTPSGGTVSIETDGQITSALYTCQTGYTISGTSTVTCRSDGTWDFTTAVCVSCTALSSPDNGQVSLESINSVTYANFECNAGYTLLGFDQLSCRTTGNWDFSEPSCVQCEELENVNSGYLSVVTDGVVSYVYYTCAEGYHLEGDSNRTCGTNGIWSGAKPVCICDTPAVPENGTILVSVEGDIITFSCDVGFTMVGSDTLTCRTDGTSWNGTSPSCVKCSVFDVPENGSVSYETNSVVTSVTVTCEVGSTIKGTAEITCGTSGEWAFQNNITCVSCPTLGDPVNGTTTLETNGTLTKALFSCDIGASLVGLTETSCTDEGVWSGNIPVCETCTPVDVPSPSYEPIQYSSDGLTTTLTVACVDGYHTSSSATVTCNEGLWETSLPDCVCDSLSAPTNGAASVSSDFMITVFTCDAGYTMVGETTTYCLTDGTGWNSTEPSCVLCDTLADIPSGSYNISSNGSVSLVTYTCGAGFTLSGTSERQCDTGGGWQDAEPTCVSCPTLDAPSSGTIKVTTTGQVSEAIYTCVEGYELSGDSIRECLVNGTWSFQPPSCYCTLPTAPFNGDVAYGSDVTVAKFTCDSGYTLHGYTEGYCQDNGSGWNTSVPDCVACATLSSSPGASFNISTDGTTSSAVYACDVGYTIQGDTNLECRSDGTWTVQSPTCVSCETLTLTDGASINFGTDGSVTQATITCGTGYTATGAQTLSCKADGTWDFSAGSCVVCSALETPESGFINVSSDGSVTTAMFWCESGYYLDGSELITCGTDGAWSDLTPECKCDPPETIDNGNFTIHNTGLSVLYTCDVGYSMDGSNTRSCDENGNGWTGTSPQCYKCDDLSDYYNGTVTISTDGETTTATYVCDSGYTMSGSSVVQCTQNGTWELVQPTCTQCEEVSIPSDGSFQWVTDDISSEAIFSCDVGYSLTGSSSLSCYSNGSVTGTAPSCVSCPVLDVPSNGAVTIATNGSMTTATYGCDVNYSLIGNELLTCVDGSWNESPSYCECSAFSKPSDGSIAVSEDGTSATYSCDPGFTLNGEIEQICGSQSSVNSTQTAPTCNACDTLAVSGISYSLTTDGTTTTANFECDTGYTMIGEATSSCRSDGTWTTTVPTCESCETLNPPTGGTINLSSDGSTTIATVVCGSGYSFNGVVNITCRTDGTWNFNTATCVKCPDLAAPGSGNLTLTTTGTLTNAIFDCNNGYYIDGPSSLTCGTDGTWSGDSPSCLCNSPDSVLNGVYTTSDDGMTVTYECDVGYSMNGTNARVCGSDGSGWSLQAPSCFKCDDLLEQTNGSVTLSSDGVSTFATVTCDTGYSVSGSSVITCQPDGSWNIEQSSCVKCEEIAQPENGSFILISNGTTTSTQYSCNVGFTLSGSSDVTCSANGSWTGQTPSCVSCPSLVDVENGEMKIATDGSVTTATIICDQDYSLYGNSLLACTSSGVWNGSIPECVCSIFIQPDDGDLVISENGTKATYSCAAGFTLSGDVEQTCGGQSSSGGTLEAPTCTMCDSLSTSSGATFELTTDGSKTTATFHCPTGYTMVGASNLTCRTDGSWDISPPECRTCETLPTVVGGDIEITTNGEQTQAQFTCDLGSTLSGQTTLSCRTDGTWDFTQPECVGCPVLTDPANGHMNSSTTGQVSVAMFYCTEGYYLVGNEALTCSESGTWDNDSPTCVCDPPESLQNGLYMLSNDSMTVTYECDVGFSMNGSSTRVCGSDGSGWSQQTPSCYKCDDLLEQTNGSVSLSSDGVSTFATFECDTGFSISGTSIVECHADGSWSIEQASCEKCSEITQPGNGSIISSSNGTTTSTLYSCDIGFTLSGSPEVTCNADGTWSDQSPSCVSCPSLSDLENGQVAISTDGSVNIASFTCDQDYSLHGNGILACTSSGIWNGSSPECVCSTFIQPVDGDLVISENGTKATYSCAAGFTLSGDVEQTCGGQSSSGGTLEAPTCTTCDTLSASTGATFELSTDGSQTVAIFQCPAGYTMVGTSNATCRTDGSWDITPPECQTCETLPAVVGGNIEITTDGEQTQAEFTCDIGSSLTGQTTLSCRTDGTWDFTQPECVSCPALVDPANGQVNQSTTGQVTVAKFSCVGDYYLDGNEILTCLESGVWDSVSPTCICDPPEDIINGAYVLSNDGMSVTYICDVNYTLNGTTTRTCGNNSNGWDGVAPTCYKCDDLSGHVNGTISTVTDGVSTSATFTCAEGLSLSGSSVLQCLPDGTWDVDQPSCEKCEDVVAPNNGTLTFNSNGTSTRAEYSCDVGFSVSGSVEMYCTADGTWTGEFPSCVSCPTLESPDNGEVTVTSNGSVTIATYSCFQDYSLFGDDVRTCTSSGAWDGAAPTCVCSTFIEPSDGSIEISDNGTEATYSCGAGFTLSGDVQQTCGVVINVGDTVLTPPTCVTCESISTSSGAIFELSTDGSETVATFQCPAGYTLVGASNLTCRTDGSWDISPPTCETCDTLATVFSGSVSFVTDGEQTQAVFTCDPGATLSGSSTLSCRTDGSWDITQPDCVTCPSLNDPVNGQVNVSTSGQVSVAQFSCTEGYYVFGNETLTCLESGSWDYDTPTCRCTSPPNLPNGTLLISADGESALYACAAGFSLNGDSERTCKTDGTGWSGSQPVCEQCQLVPSASNLDYNLSSDGTSTTAEFTCETGSSIIGEATLTCLPNGSWSDGFPTCVECPSLTADSRGTLSYTSNGTVTTTLFQCDMGSALIGSVQIFCKTDGTWSDSEPTCVQCPDLATPVNGEVVMSVNGSTTWATFSCDDGYSITGNSQIYCTTNGTWDNEIPVCECDSFTKPLNGYIEVAANNSLATVTCDEGFALSGETTRYCSAFTDSSDSSSTPSCVSCESLTTSSGTSLELSTDGVNTVATYSCDNGHVMNGERILTCRSDGTWNHQPPICSVCDPLDSPVGGSVLLNSDGENTTAVYTCANGFSLVGQSELTCKSDGSWNFVQPTCECDQPASLDNGDVELSSDKLTASYSCDIGYTLSGPDTRHCRTNGSWWDGTDPVCNECSTLDVGVGMNITLLGDGRTTSAMFNCENGYSLSHTNNVTCLSDGSWNIEAPSCVQCDSLSTTTALSFSIHSDGLASTATFACAIGYGMSGPQSITCTRNGSWSMAQPTCFETSDLAGQQQCVSDSGGSGAAIAFGVLFGIATIAAIILAVVAWRYRRKSKSNGEPKTGPFFKGDVQFNPLFHEIDRDKITPSRAPMSHERHVTDMGRADSSLAPRGHHKHVIESGNWQTFKSPAPLTTRNIELQKPPMMTGRRSPSMIMSATPSSLGDASLGPYLPEQIISPRITSSAASSILDVPKIQIEVPKPKRADKVIKKPRKPDTEHKSARHTEQKSVKQTEQKLQKQTEQKSAKLSPFLPIKEKEQHMYREGSPLPQQILTPRNADDIIKEQESKQRTQIGEQTQRREKKPKGDLIDKDKSLLKIYNRKDTNSPTPGISSPQYQKLAGFEQDNEISDIEV